MSHPSWDDVVEVPDELDDETAGALYEDATEVQDMTGEVRLYPQVEAKKAVAGLDAATATVRTSGDGRYRIFMRKD